MTKHLLFKSITLLALVSGVNAQPLVCPFTDTFKISSATRLTMTSLASDGNVVVISLDPLVFQATCKSFTSTSNGNVYFTLKKDDANLCTLHLIDGPFEMNPTITFINCIGQMQFVGMDHAWGTYSYTLKFA